MWNGKVLLIFSLLLAGLALLFATSGAQTTESGPAVRLQIQGAIGMATGEYITKGIEHADRINARLIIIEMDTPGGLDSAMRDIIKAILNSNVPVATYVTPSGSRAASAGTYILYGSHIAAMAPATHLGAATPVQIGGGEKPSAPIRNPLNPDEGDDDGESADAEPGGAEPESAGNPSSAMERKTVNDAVAYIRGLAELRNRNADWAESAVREAVSLSASDALAQNVIDLIAESTPQLLAEIDGRTVNVRNEERTLSTEGLTIEDFEPDWRTRLLLIITDPNIAYMLMLVGIYGLLFEGYNPGAIVPGVVGAICILLALFAFQVLPINYAGLALILLGIILIIAEAFVPSFGALGMGGIAAFVFGSIILMDTDIPGFSISRTLIGSIALLGSVLMLGLMLLIARNFRRPVVSGTEAMIGSTGEAVDAIDQTGTIFIHGEHWQARSGQPIAKGTQVRVTAIHGLELEVEPANS
jgi:membrane-bound serine protease (ClpP class)